METLVQVLMHRDDLTEADALADIAACREEMLVAIEAGNFSYAEQIFEDWFGLEPDYIVEVVTIF